jgi:hypothetical protein
MFRGFLISRGTIVVRAESEPIVEGGIFQQSCRLPDKPLNQVTTYGTPDQSILLLSVRELYSARLTRTHAIRKRYEVQHVTQREWQGILRRRQSHCQVLVLLISFCACCSMGFDPVDDTSRERLRIVVGSSRDPMGTPDPSARK